MTTAVLIDAFANPRWAAANEERLGRIMAARAREEGHRQGLPSGPKGGWSAVAGDPQVTGLTRGRPSAPARVMVLAYLARRGESARGSLLSFHHSRRDELVAMIDVLVAEGLVASREVRSGGTSCYRLSLTERGAEDAAILAREMAARTPSR